MIKSYDDISVIYSRVIHSVVDMTYYNYYVY